MMKRMSYENILNYHVSGLEESDKVNAQIIEEMEKRIDDFKVFETNAREKYKILIARHLYGNLAVDEFKQEISKYENVQTGLINIPGRISEKDFQENLYKLMDEIIHQLECLKVIAEDQKIYKKDFKNIRRNLLDLFINLFGSARDLLKFEESVHKLEEIKIIPEGSKDSLIKLTSMNRWA